MPVPAYCIYASADASLRQALETHVSAMMRQGLISLWHDQQIAPGQDRIGVMDTHLNGAAVILLLVSPDFLASTVKILKYTFPGIIEIESKRFLESGIKLVECPGSGRIRSLEPRNETIRFLSHDRQKTRTPNTDRRWVQEEAAWEVE